MKTGPRPKPLKLRLLDGDAHRERMNFREPKPAPVRPTCPAYLGTLARAEWRRLVPELMQLGLLTRIDRAALAAYCQAYGRWVEAEKVLKDKGPLYATKAGNVIISPMLSVANRAMDQMHRFLTEFGMTPASRSRIVVNPSGGDDEEGLLD